MGGAWQTLDMTAKRGSAANLDCRHDASLSEVQVIGVGRAPRLTVAAEYIRHLEVRPDHFELGVRSQSADSNVQKFV